MFVYQVLFPSFLLLVFGLIIPLNSQTPVAATVSCSPPYFLLNSICVLLAPPTIRNASPQPCPNQPVNLIPVVPALPQPCPTQQVTPCPPVPAQPQPCPTQQVTPCNPVPAQPQPCPTQQVTPFPPVPTQPQPCPTQPVTPYPPVPQPTPPYYQTIPTMPTATTTTTTTTTTTRRSTTLPPPAPLRRCPKGTVLINDECRLVYCSRGVYDSDRCVEIRCPKYSYWTGEKCAYPQPAETSHIHLNKTIINKKSNETPDLILNNIQNLVVNASFSIPTDYRDYEEDSLEMDEVLPQFTPSLPTAPPATKCCTVLAPRTCRCPMETHRCQCFNPKEQICGDICITPKVALYRNGITSWTDNNMQMLTMPPNWNSECQRLGHCSQVANRYDCSGCALGEISSCSPYCYNSKCNSPRCSYYDHQQFCDLPQSAGSKACRIEYGWGR